MNHSGPDALWLVLERRACRCHVLEVGHVLLVLLDTPELAPAVVEEAGMPHRALLPARTHARHHETDGTAEGGGTAQREDSEIVH